METIPTIETAETIERNRVGIGETPSSDCYSVIVSVLCNPSFPLLRYRIEDIACSPLETPETGFAKLGCVLGRDNDVLKSLDGRVVHSMAVKHVLEADLRIRRFHVYQSASGDLAVQVESNASASELNLPRVRSHLSDLIDGYAVSITVTDQIPGNLAGKHRWIVSDLNQMKTSALHANIAQK